MTVGVATICESGKCIVAVTDHKVTMGNFSAEGVALKGTPLGLDWGVLFAGEDMTHVDTIVERAFEILLEQKETPDSVYSFQAVAAALADAYDERLQQQIEFKYLKNFGLTVADFRDNGKTKLSSAFYDQLVSQIANESLGCQFLACGFGEERQAHIVCLDEQGPPGNYDNVGFWAIGSGASAALSSLAFHANLHGFDKHSSLEEGIYHTLEAKFMAESSPLVGEETFIVVYQRGAKLRFLKSDGVEKIRQRWEKHGSPRVPSGLLPQIKGMLYEESDSEEEG